MSAAAWSPILRSRLAGELGRVLREHPHTTIAAWCGISETTPARRGSRPDQWPLSELGQLAAHDPDLAAALRTYVCGSAAPTAAPARAIAGLYDVLSSSGETVTSIVAAIRDQRITAAEAGDLRPRLRALLAQISQAELDLGAFQGDS